VSVLVPVRSASRPSVPGPVGRLEAGLAVAAFGVLCAVALRVRPVLVEPDDFAYKASIVAVTQGHLFTLSTAQARALAERLGLLPAGLGTGGQPLLVQWVHLASGRWISEKDPGYPYLAAPFQALGLIRLAPLGYGALGCLGLFAGGRRWLGRYGGTVAVALFCSSGAAMLFAWRDYMPTFTDASLAAAGTGVLLWAMLAADGPVGRRTWAGLAGFVALEAATFTRYTDIVVLGCAVLAVAAALIWWPAAVPPGAWRWWLGSVAVSGAGVAVFDSLIYGGPFRSGYRPGEIQFSLSALLPAAPGGDRSAGGLAAGARLALAGGAGALGRGGRPRPGAGRAVQPRARSFTGMTGPEARGFRVQQIAPGGPAPGQPAPVRGPVPGPGG
jgi:hypothetical protein